MAGIHKDTGNGGSYKEEENVTEHKADSQTEKEFIDYLKEIGLHEYYPGKLRMEHATEVRLLPNDDSDRDIKDLPFIFMSKLTSLDSRIAWKEKLKVVGSVRDFIYAMLCCSDDHLRQHLMEKLASCQLAVTVLLPSILGNGKPQLLLWALGRIVKKWKESKESVAPEKRVVSEPVFTAAFIRFGDVSISKSTVLNTIIGRVQGYDQSRCFISHEEEKEDVFFLCGSVEAQWYLPVYGREEDIMKEVTLLLNLRGDAEEFPIQRNVMCKVANAVFVFVDKRNVEEYKGLIDKVKHNLKKVFVIYIKEPEVRKGRHRSRIPGNIETEIIRERDKSVEVKKDINLYELGQIICGKIVQYCNDTGSSVYKSIEDWPNLCSDEIVVDQENESYRRAKQLIDKAFPKKSKKISDMKKTYLPLQEKWVKWVTLDKECMTIEKDHTIGRYFAEKKSEQINLRQQQRNEGLSKEMEIFSKTLQTVLFKETENTLKYFMTLFKTHIESIISSEIPKLLQKISKVHAEMKDKRSTKKIPSSSLGKECKKLQDELLKYSNQLSDSSITCEHFIRELGHLYESGFGGSIVVKNEQNETLITIAATLILKGYALELLDGETAYIPIKWISDVLKKVQTTLKDSKIYVMSIIGIQGSGKSTFLNCMFGVRFPVRAGRCTRGLYLQLLHVNADYHERFGFEYLLIIDTEGLQCPDRTVINDHKFDNTVATLSMCIGDLTLLNIGGETIASDMIGLLQIAAHALLRMKQVKLKSTCRIIQQRVCDISAAANNKSNIAKIKDALNKAIEAVAFEEKVKNITEFSDLFPFAEDDDLQFFPTLWTSSMSPPNFEYSDKIYALKADICSVQTDRSRLSPQFTMATFISRLKDVWKAVKTENFVFHFQSSFDALSNQRFRLYHSRLIGKMRTAIVEWELKRSNDLGEDTKDKFYEDLEAFIKTECKNVNDKIDMYVKEHSNEEEVKRRQESIKNDTIDIGKNIQRGIGKSAEICLESRENVTSMPKFITEAKANLKSAVHDAVMKLREEKSNLDLIQDLSYLENRFESFWKKQTESLNAQFSQTKISDKNIDKACQSCFTSLMERSEHCKEYIRLVKERQRNKGNFSSVNIPLEDNGDPILVKINAIKEKYTRNIQKHCLWKPFQQHLVDTLLNVVYNKLKDHEVDTETLVMHLDNVRSEMAAVCKECQKKYEEHNSLELMFESEKESMKKEFLSCFHESIKTEAAVERTYSDLMCAGQRYILNYFNKQVLDEMREESQYCDKQCMIGAILEELCYRKDAVSYRNFIMENGKFIREWLHEKVLEKITSEWGSKTILSEIEEVIDSIDSALCNTKINAPLQFSEWRTQFLVNLKSIYKDSFKKAFSVEGFMLGNTDDFVEALRDTIKEKMKNEICRTLNVNELTNKTAASRLCSRMKKDVVHEILDQTEGCDELCPFWKVNCHVLKKGNHKHIAVLHYPEGIAGYRWESSQLLLTSTCTSLVASQVQYKISEGPPKEYRPYKHYREDYPDWEIPEEDNKKTIDYWKWVVQTFNDDFASLYNAKPAKIPDDWVPVTQEEALENLREKYPLIL